MSTNNLTPPIFPKTDHFDRKNFTTFKTQVLIAAKVRGVHGYLEGATHTINTMTGVEATPWTSLTPSHDEWEACDTWAMGLIIFNTKNPTGLGVRTEGMAAEAWTSLTN
ncbi:hypothetical protein BDZ94DRAFT_1174383, partial [Collybia nuda]